MGKASFYDFRGALGAWFGAEGFAQLFGARADGRGVGLVQGLHQALGGQVFLWERCWTRAKRFDAPSPVGLVNAQRAEDAGTAPTQAFMGGARPAVMHHCRAARKEPGVRRPLEDMDVRVPGEIFQTAPARRQNAAPATEFERAGHRAGRAFGVT